MELTLDSIWRLTRSLSRAEKMALLEKLVHQLRIEDKQKKEVIAWEQMYGIGKGIWDVDAQEYVNQLREERF